MTMQESKKYMITGLIGLIIVGIAAFFLMHENKLPQSIKSPIAMPQTELTDMFAAAPVGYDQLIYIRADEEVVTTLESLDASFASAEYKALVEQVEYALLVQYVVDDVLHDLLFLEGADIDITALQQAGLIAVGEDVEAKQLGEQIWVYGSQAALRWREKSTAYLHDDTIVKTFSEQFHAGKQSIGFMSLPRPVVTTPLVNQFAQQLEHTMVFSRLDTQEIVGKVIMQFTDGVIGQRTEAFVPRLSGLFGSDTLAYIEMSDILGFFGVTKEDFMSIAPLVIGQQQGGVYGALMQDEDYTSLYDALYGHIAIGLVTSPDLFGIGGHIVFSDPDIYDTLAKLSPLWTSLIGGFVGGSGSLQQEVTSTGLVWKTDSALFADDGVAGDVVELNKNDDYTILSLLTEGLEATTGGSGLVAGYDENTVLTFSFDNEQLQQLMQAQQALLGQSTLPSVDRGISRWVGDIQAIAEDNQIVVHFSVE